MQKPQNIIWARSLLSVYRQAAIEAARPDVDASRRQTLLDELGRVHVLFASHDNLDDLWQRAFGGIESGLRAALRPLSEAASAPMTRKVRATTLRRTRTDAMSSQPNVGGTVMLPGGGGVGAGAMPQQCGTPRAAVRPGRAPSPARAR